MEHRNRRYTEDEVTNIIRHSLSRSGPRDTISHDELVDIARASGISADKLDRAIEHMETKVVIENAKKEWLRRHRSDFFNHLTSYFIVNGFLIFIYLWTMRGGYFWPIWPMAGWGIGMAILFVDTFMVSDERVERGAQRLLERKRRQASRRDWADREGYES